MRVEQIERAEQEAQRFLVAAASAQRRIKADGNVVGYKETGACRRASLDLTRALADLRKP